MVRVGVVGYGYWGPNLVRNFAEAKGAEVAAVCDMRPQRLELAKTRHPSIEITSQVQDLIANPKIDAIAISTPISTHFDLALAALQAGKHVWVEKPLTGSSEQARRLIEEAEKRKLVLLVDHTFVYTGAVRKIRELTSSGRLGQLYYYDSVRVNLGLFQHDLNVLWDLAVHDLAIMDFVLLGATPRAVSATGISHVPGGVENIAYLTVFFDNSLIAHIHVNWLAPVKVRRTLIGGSQEMIVFDDLESSEKVKVYDRGITLSDNTSEKLYQTLIGYRTGDMWSPNLETTEALLVEANHFVRCIEQGEQPVTGGREGLRVVEILEAATASMRDRGRLVELPTGGQTA